MAGKTSPPKSARRRGGGKLSRLSVGCPNLKGPIEDPPSILASSLIVPSSTIATIRRGSDSDKIIRSPCVKVIAALPGRSERKGSIGMEFGRRQRKICKPVMENPWQTD
ncbi:predicted protein [Histoplasma capsulatum G186AR]|uniref:Uncharacterized protein n=1 Tax=Ajellomyces capsulatus (strain G186AR / H82 / ATCC MYA-2454 / RMSCC 2432) TaxID=447093 RepID=C0NEV5_AJECG|nr:uncharacterized protein HCBG_01421 [Histoplasma capsulatum G186AR]EEH09776.1 predicted protein [Histoplasma capsulatum G186AR]